MTKHQMKKRNEIVDDGNLDLRRNVSPVAVRIFARVGRFQ